MAEDDEASAARTERWEARLGSLETRLQMLETSLKAEVDRIHLAAEGVDGLVGDLRGTIGETRNLTELVNDVGDRLTLLHSLEATVTDAARNVADSVYAAVTERLAQLEQGLRDGRPDLGPIEASVVGLRADLEQLSVGIGAAVREVRPDHTQLHSHLDAIRAELDQRTGALADQLVQLRAGQVDLAPLASAVDQLAGAVTARLDELGEQVHGAQAALREQPDVAAPLQRIVAEVADLRVTVPQLSGRIDELRRAVDAAAAASPPGQLDELRRVVLELAAAPPDLTSVVTPIATRIDQLATVVDQLAASSGPASNEALSARPGEQRGAQRPARLDRRAHRGPRWDGVLAAVGDGAVDGHRRAPGRVDRCAAGVPGRVRAGLGAGDRPARDRPRQRLGDPPRPRAGRRRRRRAAG